jgi:hypothetical protein
MVRSFDEFVNENVKDSMKKHKSFMKIWKKVDSDNLNWNKLQSDLEQIGLKVVKFSDLKNRKYKGNDFPPDSVIYAADSDPSDEYYLSSNYENTAPFEDFADYKEMYSDSDDGIAFIY